MPSTTSTSTVVVKDHPRKGTLDLSPSSSTLATLRVLYPRAAHSFVNRQVVQTHSSIESAFSLLSPPASAQRDNLHSHRKKWDILRITLEATVFGPLTNSSTLPPALRANLLVSPATFLTTLHSRSMRLFTPSYLKPSPVYLPGQVVAALGLAAVKVEAPRYGKTFIEEWLARRGEPDEKDADGYAKVIKAYCLDILPHLGEWDYAAEFLQYEGELPVAQKKQIEQQLESDHARHIAASAEPTPTPTRTPTPQSSSSAASDVTVRPPPRPPSPASSESSTSTHTAVPLTPRARRTQTVTSLSKAGESSSKTPLPRPPSAPTLPPTVVSQRVPLLAMIKASIAPYLSSRTSLLFLLIFPFIALLFRARSMKRSKRPPVSPGAGDRARRRLQAAARGESVWASLLRVVGDTVKMGGRGLV